MANNPKANLGSTMTEAQIAAVKTALETIQNNMPFLHRLPATKRNKLYPIGTETRIFTENTIHVLVNNPECTTGRV